MGPSVAAVVTADFGRVDVVHRDCPLCGSDNRSVVAHRYSHPTWTLKTCKNCDFLYIEIAPDYTALFTSMAWEVTTQVETKRREAARPIGHKLSKKTRSRLHILPRRKLPDLVRDYAPPGRIVDLGCGDGGQFDGLGADWTPFGIEISTAAAARAKTRFAASGGDAVNLDCLSGLQKFDPDYFTAATLRSYLEHELNPAQTLREVLRVLAPGGVAIVKVPNFASLNRIITREKWCGFRFPDHLNYFTPASLRRLAEQCGFEYRQGFADKLPTSDNMYAFLYKPKGQ